MAKRNLHDGTEACMALAAAQCIFVARCVGQWKIAVRKSNAIVHVVFIAVAQSIKFSEFVIVNF